MKKTTRIYSDLDLNFTPHPLSGDIVKKYDEQAISRSLRNLVMTNAGDRPFHPEIDIGIRKYLFEPATFITQHDIKSAIEFGIAKFEKRAKVQSVTVVLDEQTQQDYEVTIVYTTENMIEPVTVIIFLQRIR